MDDCDTLLVEGQEPSRLPTVPLVHRELDGWSQDSIVGGTCARSQEKSICWAEFPTAARVTCLQFLTSFDSIISTKRDQNEREPKTNPNRLFLKAHHCYRMLHVKPNRQNRGFERPKNTPNMMCPVASCFAEFGVWRHTLLPSPTFLGKQHKISAPPSQK